MKLRHEIAILVFLITSAIASFHLANPRFLAGFFEGDKAVSDQLATLLEQYQTKPPHFDNRVKDADCHVDGPLPDHACSPGAIFPEATVEQICVKGYTQAVRDVPVSLKKKVYGEYGISYPQRRGAYEVDHLIPLELGGNNDIANLFPEAAEPASPAGGPSPGFREKDLVENYLHNEVCANQISLAAAQQQIASDWLAVYKTLTPDQLAQLKQAFRSF